MLLQSSLRVKNSLSISPKSGCCNWNFLLLLLSIVIVENRHFSSVLSGFDGLEDCCHVPSAIFSSGKKRMCFTDFWLLLLFPKYPYFPGSRTPEVSHSTPVQILNGKVISLCSLSLLHSAACLLSCVEPARFYTLQTMLKNSPYLSSLWKKKNSPYFH